MKFFYIANIRMPTEKAHGLQIMKMCESFARQGAEVELVVPWRFNPIKEDPFEYYGVEKNFKITKLPSLDLVKLGKTGFLIQALSFAKCAFWYALFKKADVVHSRDELSLFYLSFFKKNLFWEVHTKKFDFTVKRLLRKCKGIISISRGLKNFYFQKGALADKILVAPDGVDLKEFDITTSKKEARQKLNLPQDKNLIGYVGMLRTMGMEKGIDTAIQSLKFADENSLLVLAGGRDEDIEFYKKLTRKLNLENKVLFIGRVPHQLVPLYLKAFDVLIAPFPEEEHYKFYMSPLKIFEYMASGRPIVASDLLSIREVLNQKNAVLVEPNSAEALAGGIKAVLAGGRLYDKISEQAYLDVQNYTWQKRARKILNFIGSI